MCSHLFVFFVAVLEVDFNSTNLIALIYSSSNNKLRGTWWGTVHNCVAKTHIYKQIRKLLIIMQYNYLFHINVTITITMTMKFRCLEMDVIYRIFYVNLYLDLWVRQLNYKLALVLIVFTSLLSLRT